MARNPLEQALQTLRIDVAASGRASAGGMATGFLLAWGLVVLVGACEGVKGNKVGTLGRTRGMVKLLGWPGRGRKGGMLGTSG